MQVGSRIVYLSKKQSQKFFFKLLFSSYWSTIQGNQRKHQPDIQMKNIVTKIVIVK